MRELFLNAAKKGGKVNKNIYGHFAEHLGRCVYNGLYVGENSAIPNVRGMRRDVVAALRDIKLPVLRWPGGCFADEYHWRDGVGPKENRKKMVNTHWGGVTEDNSFGTREFFDLCAQIGCEPYITGNMGSGTVQEMSEWVEYINFDGVSPMAELRAANGNKEAWALQYFGVGNENWGCGGNMRPEYYADEYRRYQTYARNYPGKRLFKIACGPNGNDVHWTDVVMKNAHFCMDGLSLHYYTVPGTWHEKEKALGFNAAQYYQTLERALYMDELIQNHSRVMDKYDPQKRVGLIVDEWGTWYQVEEGTNPGFLYQQNTMRDAMVAAVSLNVFNRRCGRVVMANLAQLVNVLQAVILTEGEKMILTPTYHVFDMYKEHQDGTLIDSYAEAAPAGAGDISLAADLDVSATLGENGVVHATLANLSVTDSQEIFCRAGGFTAQHITARILTGPMDAHNDFGRPDTVKPAALHNITPKDGGFVFTVPACSVVSLSLSEA